MHRRSLWGLGSRSGKLISVPLLFLWRVIPFWFIFGFILVSLYSSHSGTQGIMFTYNFMPKGNHSSLNSTRKEKLCLSYVQSSIPFYPWKLQFMKWWKEERYPLSCYFKLSTGKSLCIHFTYNIMLQTKNDSLEENSRVEVVNDGGCPMPGMIKWMMHLLLVFLFQRRLLRVELITKDSTSTHSLFYILCPDVSGILWNGPNMTSESGS